MNPIPGNKSTFSQAFDQWLKSDETKMLIQDSINCFKGVIDCYVARLAARAYIAGAQEQRRIILDHVSLN
jgi:hypothetical protein